MRELVNVVGNIRVIAVKNIDNSISIELYNGTDEIFSEGYFNSTFHSASEKALQQFDIYTVDYLSSNYTMQLHKLSENTYRVEDDYFCRIDETIYFKHLTEAINGWLVDKEGKRIIDR